MVLGEQRSCLCVHTCAKYATHVASFVFINSVIYPLREVARWHSQRHGGVVIQGLRVLQAAGHCCIVTLNKLYTLMCFCCQTYNLVMAVMF